MVLYLERGYANYTNNSVFVHKGTNYFLPTKEGFNYLFLKN